MNAARVKTSRRLQRTLRVLREAGSAGLTTRQLMRRANICAVNSVIAELRVNGCEITTRREDAPSGKRYTYVLIKGPSR